MGVILSVVEEIKTGLRELSIDELGELTSMWSDLNDGLTPSEIALRMIKDLE